MSELAALALVGWVGFALMFALAMWILDSWRQTLDAWSRAIDWWAENERRWSELSEDGAA